jgi:hypothetical protein
MTTLMTETSWSWSEQVSDTVPNRLMCWISCSDICVTFYYRLVYRQPQGDDQYVSFVLDGRQDNHPPSLPPNHKKKGGQPQNGGTTSFFTNCHGLALLVGPLGEAIGVVLLGGAVLGVENGQHFKNSYSAKNNQPASTQQSNSLHRLKHYTSRSVTT